MDKAEQKRIREMSYTDFIALLQETNRCPGGKRTVRRIRELLHIDKNTKMLEVGSNTGFTSLEFARISPAKHYGIDISEECVCVANKIKEIDVPDIKDRVSFQVGSSYNIPFPEENFDIVMTGGATGFMDKKSTALREYFRVLKTWGFLVMTPLVYHTTPPQEVLDSVSKIIGTKITAMGAGDWEHMVTEENSLWELYHQEPHTLAPRTESDIHRYISHFMSKQHLRDLPSEIRQEIEARWRSHIHTFNENHKYLGCVIQIYRKRNIEEEPELFISS